MKNSYGTQWPPKCRKCKREVIKGVGMCPHCGAAKPSTPHFVMFLYLVAWVFIIGFILKTCSDSRASKPKLDVDLTGVQCLSPWNGSHRNFNEEIKRNLRDPDSFKHVRTRVGPKMVGGSHRIFVDYRAKNGFGGVNSNTAHGELKASNCRHKLIAIK